VAKDKSSVTFDTPENLQFCIVVISTPSGFISGIIIVTPDVTTDTPVMVSPVGEYVNVYGGKVTTIFNVYEDVSVALIVPAPVILPVIVPSLVIKPGGAVKLVNVAPGTG
jgi:hypothetical protein